MKLIKPDSSDQSVMTDDGSAFLCSVFLAGSIDNGAASLWADKVAHSLSDLDIVCYNPRVDEWDANLEPRMREPKFAAQVNWELDSIDAADVVFFYFEAGSISPITLQELGYVIGRGTQSIVVCCPDEFWRKGNVEIMCKREGIVVHNTLDEALTDLRDLLNDSEAHWYSMTRGDA